MQRDWVIADSTGYEPVLSAKATSFLVSLSNRRQKMLIQLLRQLACQPGQLGDYSERDDTGRDVQFILAGDLVIAFWADHPAREFRIVDVEEV